MLGCNSSIDVSTESNVEYIQQIESITNEETIVNIPTIEVLSNENKYIKAPTVIEKDFLLTFYTDLAQENSIYGSVNCLGEQLQPYMIASNYYKLGTKIELEGYGVKEVRDRGGKSFNKDNRLDVHIPRNAGESNRDYYNRIQKMGVQKVKGYIYISEGEFVDGNGE